MASFEPTTYSDDGSHLKATNLLTAVKHMHESSKLFGKDMTSSSTWKDRMAKAGFINVTEDVYKVCSCSLKLINTLTNRYKVTTRPMAEGPQVKRARQVSSSQFS
jgi:hypothetical protein